MFLSVSTSRLHPCILWSWGKLWRLIVRRIQVFIRVLPSSLSLSEMHLHTHSLAFVTFSNKTSCKQWNIVAQSSNKLEVYLISLFRCPTEPGNRWPPVCVRSRSGLGVVHPPMNNRLSQINISATCTWPFYKYVLCVDILWRNCTRLLVPSQFQNRLPLKNIIFKRI